MHQVVLSSESLGLRGGYGELSNEHLSEFPWILRFVTPAQDAPLHWLLHQGAQKAAVPLPPRPRLQLPPSRRPATIEPSKQAQQRQQALRKMTMQAGEPCGTMCVCQIQRNSRGPRRGTVYERGLVSRVTWFPPKVRTRTGPVAPRGSDEGPGGEVDEPPAAPIRRRPSSAAMRLLSRLRAANSARPMVSRASRRRISWPSSPPSPPVDITPRTVASGQHQEKTLEETARLRLRLATTMMMTTVGTTRRLSRPCHAREG